MLVCLGIDSQVSCVSLCLPYLPHAGVSVYWQPGQLCVSLYLPGLHAGVSRYWQTGQLCISLSSWSSFWCAWVLTARSVDCVSLCLPGLLHAGVSVYWHPGQLCVSVFPVFFMLVCLCIDTQVSCVSVFPIFFILVCLGIDNQVSCVSLCLPDLLHAGASGYWQPGQLSVCFCVFLSCWCVWVLTARSVVYLSVSSWSSFWCLCIDSQVSCVPLCVFLVFILVSLYWQPGQLTVCVSLPSCSCDCSTQQLKQQLHSTLVAMQWWVATALTFFLFWQWSTASLVFRVGVHGQTFTLSPHPPHPHP